MRVAPLRKKTRTVRSLRSNDGRGLVIRKFLSAAVVAFFVFAPAPGLTHAYVDSSSPSQGARVDSGPREVSVSFDQPVSAVGADVLVVRDERGRKIPCSPAAGIDPYNVTRLVCPLKRALGAGRYGVAWRVVSADTHVVHGTFAFGVGVDVAAGAAQVDRASLYDPASPPATILRWLQLYGALVACGALAFETSVASGATVALGRASSRCRKLALAGACVALVAALPALVVQVLAGNGGRGDTLASAMLPTVGRTLWGYAWLLRLGALAVLAAVATFRGPLAARVGTAAGACALLSFSLSGHALDAASLGLVAANVIVDFTHTAGAAIWVGGLAAFVVVLPLVSMRSAIVAFSPLAVGAVLAIVLSGTYASLVHVGSFQALTASAYGWIVVAKTALFVPLLALGARNFMRGRDLAALAGAPRDLRFEAALAVVIVALSAVLTGLPPARDAVRATANVTANSTG